MRGPDCPRSWLNWSIYVLESQGRPFFLRYDGIPGSDPRTSDSRETALSVVRMLERAGNGNGGNAVTSGAELLLSLYVDETPWIPFTEAEKKIIRRTTRRFVRELRMAGFMPES